MTDSEHTNPSHNDLLNDELLTRLKAANPVASGERLVSETAADTLFDQITSRSPGFTPYSTTGTAAVPNARRISSRRTPTTEPAGNRVSRSALLAAVAAVAALLIGSLVVFAPNGTQPALATVQAAAQETADARSGRVVTEFDVVGREDAEQASLSGAMTAAFAGENFSVGIDLDPSNTVMSPAEAEEISRAETRLVDGQLYVTPDGDEWMSIEAPVILQSTLARLTDLRTILAQVEELVEVEIVGPSELDGLAVTHYRSEVDLADQTLAESGWLPGAQGAQGTPVDIDAQGTVTVDLYVDANGLMRRIEVSGEATPVDETIDASADFTVVTNFVDLDSDITIEAPDPSVVQTFEMDGAHDLSELDD